MDDAERERRADAIAQAMISDTRYLNRNATPRDAAEQLLGRRMTDVEWQQHRELWERNWALTPNPHSLGERLRRFFGTR